jgi:hypothetical protein
LGSQYLQNNIALFSSNMDLQEKMADLKLEDKLALIKENLVEVINPELIEKPWAEGRNPKIYWVLLTLSGRFRRFYLTVLLSRVLRPRESLIVPTCRFLYLLTIPTQTDQSL